MTYRKLIALLGGASILALAAAPAGAADKPSPCASVFHKDAKGDQVMGPVFGGPPLLAETGPENMDIQRVFFNTVGGVTTANIEVTNLTKDVPAGYLHGKFAFDVDFANIDDIAWARAEVSESGVEFYLVTVENGATNTGKVPIKGNFVEGPLGIVQIELPADVFKPGLTLENVFAISTHRSDDNNQLGYINDSAPDDGATSAKKHTITECPPAPASGGGGNQGSGTNTNTGQTPQPTQPQPTQQEPRQTAAAKKKQASCAKKAKKKYKGKKNAKKRKKALKKCKKASKRNG